jgi:hypothetical protein
MAGRSTNSFTAVGRRFWLKSQALSLYRYAEIELPIVQEN